MNSRSHNLKIEKTRTGIPARAAWICYCLALALSLIPAIGIYAILILLVAFILGIYAIAYGDVAQGVAVALLSFISAPSLLIIQSLTMSAFESL